MPLHPGHVLVMSAVPGGIRDCPIIQEPSVVVGSKKIPISNMELFIRSCEAKKSLVDILSKNGELSVDGAHRMEYFDRKSPSFFYFSERLLPYPGSAFYLAHKCHAPTVLRQSGPGPLN
jgi:hypothetical protein